MDYINSILLILYSLSLVNKYLAFHFLINISIILLDFSIILNLHKISLIYYTINLLKWYKFIVKIP